MVYRLLVVTVCLFAFRLRFHVLLWFRFVIWFCWYPCWLPSLLAEVDAWHKSCIHFFEHSPICWNKHQPMVCRVLITHNTDPRGRPVPTKVYAVVFGKKRTFKPQRLFQYNTIWRAPASIQFWERTRDSATSDIIFLTKSLCGHVGKYKRIIMGAAVIDCTVSVNAVCTLIAASSVQKQQLTYQ